MCMRIHGVHNISNPPPPPPHIANSIGGFVPEGGDPAVLINDPPIVCARKILKNNHVMRAPRAAWSDACNPPPLFKKLQIQKARLAEL